MLSIPTITHLTKVSRSWPFPRTQWTSPKTARAVVRGRAGFREEAIPVVGDIAVVTGFEELLPISALADVAGRVNHSKDGALSWNDFIVVEDDAVCGGKCESTQVFIGDPDVDSELQMSFLTHGISAVDEPWVRSAVWEDIAPKEGFEPFGLYGETATFQLREDGVALTARQSVEIDKESDETTRAHCFHLTRLFVIRSHVMMNIKAIHVPISYQLQRLDVLGCQPHNLRRAALNRSHFAPPALT